MKEGYEVVVINYRGEQGAKATLRNIYNAERHKDIGQVINALYLRYKPRKCFAVGFSYGANILANLVGV